MKKAAVKRGECPYVGLLTFSASLRLLVLIHNRVVHRVMESVPSIENEFGIYAVAQNPYLFGLLFSLLTSFRVCFPRFNKLAVEFWLKIRYNLILNIFNRTEHGKLDRRFVWGTACPSVCIYYIEPFQDTPNKTVQNRTN